MTVAWQVARIAAVLYILGYLFNHLPPASLADTGELTIPDVIWNPVIAVLQLGRLLPIETLLVLMLLTIAITTGMVLWWLGSWALGRVMGS